MPQLPLKRQLTEKQPREVLSDKLEEAQKTEMRFHDFPFGERGSYQRQPTHRILLDTRTGDNETYGHELGHSIWQNMPFMQDRTLFEVLKGIEHPDKKQFYDLLQPHWDAIPPEPNPNKMAFRMLLGEENMSKGGALYRYFKDTPHAFAAFYGNFVDSPEELKRRFPAIYRFMVALSGLEYSRTLK